MCLLVSYCQFACLYRCSKYYILSHAPVLNSPIGESRWFSAVFFVCVISKGYNEIIPNVHPQISVIAFLPPIFLMRGKIWPNYSWWEENNFQTPGDNRSHFFPPRSVWTKSLQSYSPMGLELKWQHYLQCPFNLLINIAHLISKVLFICSVSPPSIMQASGIRIVSIPCRCYATCYNWSSSLVALFFMHLHWTRHQLKTLSLVTGWNCLPDLFSNNCNMMSIVFVLILFCLFLLHQIKILKVC